MKAMPKLTVCVPSRNRQRYFQETIRSMLINLRMDVEFVLADNSDDPAIMNAFMADMGADPRVRYLPSTGSTLSMVDNWNRCVEAATGEFICMIGDDDYVDIDVADVIARTQRDHGPVDVFVWSRLTYNWPNNRATHYNVAVPLSPLVHKVPRHVVHREFYSWQSDEASPHLAFGFYHGAVSKSVMDTLKAKFGGRYCEYPVVDFENVCKVMVTAEHIFYSERCFSVLGSCAESNSGRIRLVEQVKELHAQFVRETGSNIDDYPHMKDFPFPSILGVAASIAQTQHWFLTTYGYPEIPGWEANFAAACGMSCGMMASLDDYNIMIEGYRDAFSRWHDGKYIGYFNPVAWASREGVEYFTGISGGVLLIDENIADVETPGELYHVIDQMLVHRDDLTYTVPLRHVA